VQNTSCKIKSIFLQKFWNKKKNPHSHRSNQLVWSKSSKKPMSKYMSKNSKLEKKTTDYLLSNNYSCFHKMIQAYTWTIPFLGGSIAIAPYTRSCIIYRGSPYRFFKSMKTLVTQWGFFFFFFFFPNFLCSWGVEHPISLFSQIWLLYKYESKI
jgi:hypothetical protein